VLTLGLTGRIWVAVAPVDARKSFDTLAAVVTAALGRDPLSGDLFVFANKKRDRLAVLAWQGDGFALLRRRLEKGTFALPAATDGAVAVTPTQLAMILGGLDPAKTTPRKRYARLGKTADSA
jgi:transposase